MTDQTVPGIHAKIATIQADLQRLDKGGRVALGGTRGYNYAEEPDLIEAIRPKLAAAGIAAYVDFPDLTIDGNLAIIKARLRLHDSESGQGFEATGWGTGTDNADKAAYKAMTGATRYLLQKVFLIATADASEQEQSNVPRSGLAEAEPKRDERPLSTSQVNMVRAKAHREFGITTDSGVLDTERLNQIIEVTTAGRAVDPTGVERADLDRVLRALEAYSKNREASEAVIAEYMAGKASSEGTGLDTGSGYE